MHYQTGNFIRDGQLVYGCFLIYGNKECTTHSQALKLCEERDFCYVITDEFGETLQKIYFCGYCGSVLGSDGDCHNKKCEAGR